MFVDVAVAVALAARRIDGPGQRVVVLASDDEFDALRARLVGHLARQGLRDEGQRLSPFPS